jgi:hypothetical protein
MQSKLLQALLAASFAVAAAGVSAQNATPREPTPGQASPTTGVTQNGSPVGQAPSTSPSGTQYGSPAGNASSMGSMGSTATNRMSADDIRAYMDARQACNSQPASAQDACNDAANKRFTSVDPKCQKLSGSALADCLRGADRGAK